MEEETTMDLNTMETPSYGGRMVTRSISTRRTNQWRNLPAAGTAAAGGTETLGGPAARMNFFLFPNSEIKKMSILFIYNTKFALSYSLYIQVRSVEHLNCHL